MTSQGTEPDRGDAFEALRDRAIGVELQLIEVSHLLDEGGTEWQCAAWAQEWDTLGRALAEVADKLADAA